MKNNDTEKKKEIVKLLTEKSCMKQDVYENTRNAFDLIKKKLDNLNRFLSDYLPKKYPDVNVNYRDRGGFEADLKLAGDVLVFNRHSNVFYFDRSHQIFQSSYVKEDETRAYCGMINVYNFLSDSIKYNRREDIGYLVARIFINKDMHYFVEGKREIGFLYTNFHQAIFDEAAAESFVESTVTYCLNFDLLTPPFKDVSYVSVEELYNAINNMKVKTGKRLGFKFEA